MAAASHEEKSSKDIVILVSCVATKLDHPAAAKDLYISPWFQGARAYAQRHGTKWYILSAKYGLIEPDQVIVPYNETLNSMSALQRRAWALNVESQISSKHFSGGRVIVLAGAKYREHLIGALNLRFQHVEIPMEGLSIGRQLQWLKYAKGE